MLLYILKPSPDLNQIVDNALVDFIGVTVMLFVFPGTIKNIRKPFDISAFLSYVTVEGADSATEVPNCTNGVFIGCRQGVLFKERFQLVH
jgi:hypothetical protein